MSSIYRKGEVLGWGSLAVVYRGWDELLDRPVAIKELKQPFAGSELFCRAFRAQAMKLLDVASRYVLATHAVDVDRSVLSVVRELADETVGQRSFQGPMEPEAVVQLVRQVLAGLDALHGRGLVHRAVKPENIFVSGGDYKIGDFGLPCLEGAPPVPISRYRYSSPEELREPDRVDRGSDIYSLGVVAYELILGPLRLTQVIEELLQEQGPGSRREERDEIWPRFHGSALELPPLHELEPGVPAILSLTLQRMVTKDFSARFGNCKKVLASLGSASPGEPSTGSQRLSIGANISAVAGAAPSPSPARPMVNWVWAGGGALAVATLVAGALWVSKNRDEVSPTRTAPIEAGADPAMFKPPFEDTVDPLGGPAERLLRLRSSGTGLSVGLEPSLGPGRPRLALGTPVRFRVESSRGGHLLLFALSPDGSITCLYPNARREVVAIDTGGSLVLPSDQDREAGLDLIAQEPLGRELVFAVVSSRNLPSLPTARDGSLLQEYPPGEPARDFTEWLERFFQMNSQETRMAVLDFEIGAAR